MSQTQDAEKLQQCESIMMASEPPKKSIRKRISDVLFPSSQMSSRLGVTDAKPYGVFVFVTVTHGLLERIRLLVSGRERVVVKVISESDFGSYEATSDGCILPPKLLDR